MKITTVRKLQEIFVNKICTILTTSSAKSNFQDQQFSDFFTGFVESVDEDGIFVKQHITNTMAFYSWPNVIGILEEQVIQETDPQYQKIVEEIKKTPEQVNVQPVNQFVNTDPLASLAKQAKEVQNTMLRKN